MNSATAEQTTSRMAFVAEDTTAAGEGVAGVAVSQAPAPGVRGADDAR